MEATRIRKRLCCVLIGVMLVSMLTGCGGIIAFDPVPEVSQENQWTRFFIKAANKTTDIFSILDYLFYGDDTYCDEELQDMAKGFRELEDEFYDMVDNAVSQFSDRMDVITGYIG